MGVWKEHNGREHRDGSERIGVTECECSSDLERGDTTPHRMTCRDPEKTWTLCISMWNSSFFSAKCFLTGQAGKVSFFSLEESLEEEL